MSLEDAFLRAVLADPDDDEPRLVYADWLEERDDPRGEFIRLQCILARLAGSDPIRAALAARERQLLRRHGHKWAGACRGFVHGFERGFVELVRADARTFLDRAELVFRAAPVRRVKLDRAVGLARRLATCPALARLLTLDLSGNSLFNGGAVVLAGCPALAGLETLVLARNGVGISGAVALARSPYLGGLEKLDLRHNYLGTEGREALRERFGDRVAM
jgi:uncharacterized protein (TIGR02996 family)